jgi:hypothetical protein
MRVFANLFLIMFCSDGILSLADEIISLSFSLHAFSGVRSLLANAVVVMAVPLYLCLGIDKRLPKRVFLPLTLFVLLCPFAGSMFPLLAGNSAPGLFLALAQLLLCALPLWHFRKNGKKSLVMAKCMFDGPLFGWKNTVAFFSANILAVPIALVVIAFFAANSYLSENTAGFMRLAPDGLHMVERVYQSGNKTIRLTAMIHVGEQDYYEKLADTATTGRTIILAEGVTDSGSLLKSGLDYRKVAGYLGLTSQEKMCLKGRLIDEADLDEPESAESDDCEVGDGAVILRADVDISSFRPQTIRILNELGRKMKESPSFTKGIMAFNDWAGKNVTPAMYQILLDDVLHRRNSVLIGQLRRSLARYDTIVVPWGAMHMPEIEREVLKQGFRLDKEQDRICIDLRRKLRDSLNSRL